MLRHGVLGSYPSRRRRGDGRRFPFGRDRRIGLEFFGRRREFRRRGHARRRALHGRARRGGRRGRQREARHEGRGRGVGHEGAGGGLRGFAFGARALLSRVSSPGRPSRAGVSSVSHSRSCERARFAQRGQRCDGRARVAGPWPPALAIDTNLNKAMGAGSARSKLLWTVQTSSLLQEL